MLIDTHVVSNYIYYIYTMSEFIKQKYICDNIYKIYDIDHCKNSIPTLTSEFKQLWNMLYDFPLTSNTVEEPGLFDSYLLPTFNQSTIEGKTHSDGFVAFSQFGDPNLDTTPISI